MKKKQKSKAADMLKLLIIFLIAIVLALVGIIASLKNIKSPEDEKISQAQVESEKKNQEIKKAKQTEENVIINKLSDKGERDRMEYYFSKFLKAVESKDYEHAYNMLYEDFRKNFFPTISSFEEYAQKTFPKVASVEYTNFERSGENYILWITISDSLSVTSNVGKEMKIIIRENELNDFVMSFSVI